MWIDDLVLESCDKDCNIRVWKPKDILVVLGNANNQDTECHINLCEEDRVPILKRCGGGGTVVLHDGCLVLSVGLWVKDYFKNDFYFKEINQSFIDALACFNPKFSSLYQDGLSDICFDNKKLVGTSLFRSRNYLLYQASLLVDKKIHLIERYLKHPSKEPGYRSGKPHREFVTDLSEVSSSKDFTGLEEALKESFKTILKEKLSLHLIRSVESQRDHLYKKIHSSKI